MARRIAGLPRDVLLSAVAATAWPDFQQDVMASRLIARRNALVRAFDVGEEMGAPAVPTVVPLRTPEDRLAAVRRYGLAGATGGDEAEAVSRLEGFLWDSGIVIEQSLASFEDAVGRFHGRPEDGVLETASCKESVLVAWLERTMHPSGLSRRTERRKDDRPLEPCQPTRRSLGIRRRRLSPSSLPSSPARRPASACASPPGC
jgi:hypothetical protein